MGLPAVTINVALITSSIYSWYKLFSELLTLYNAYNDKKLFYNRHNCVVMYRKQSVPSGWYPDKEKPSKGVEIKECLGPILYFINTAQKSLDIAIMTSTIPLINKALCAAHSRGVKIRMIVDKPDSDREYKSLKDHGIKVYYYVPRRGNVSSILHYKYMIKDYDANKGYAYVGSFNWTMNGIFNNYEDTVFLTSPEVIEGLYRNFKQLLQYVEHSRNFAHVQMVLNGH